MFQRLKKIFNKNKSGEITFDRLAWIGDNPLQRMQDKATEHLLLELMPDEKIMNLTFVSNPHLLMAVHQFDDLPNRLYLLRAGLCVHFKADVTDGCQNRIEQGLFTWVASNIHNDDRADEFFIDIMDELEDGQGRLTALLFSLDCEPLPWMMLRMSAILI